MTTGEASDRVLQELLDYHAPLATVRHDYPGGTVLCTPGSPVLGLNAVYATSGGTWEDGVAWQRARARPALVIGDVPDVATYEVTRIRVGSFFPVREATADRPGFVVEQASRLQSHVVACVITNAWGVGEWSAVTGRVLGTALEFSREYVPLVAYGAHKPVAAGLLKLTGGFHLWGCLDETALPALLLAAGDLARGTMQVTLPATSQLRAGGAVTLTYSLYR